MYFFMAVVCISRRAHFVQPVTTYFPVPEVMLNAVRFDSCGVTLVDVRRLDSMSQRVI